MGSIEYEITVKKNDKLFEIVADLVSDYEELLDIIPEWNHFEANKKKEQIRENLSKLFEIRKA